jgi:hypothetical protein
MTVNAAVIKKFGGRRRSLVVFARSGSEGLQGSGSTERGAGAWGQ